MKNNVSFVVTSTSMIAAEIWRAKPTAFRRHVAGLLPCLIMLMTGVFAQIIFCPASRAQTLASSGTALSFGAVNQRVSVSLASPPLSNYTISAWVYLRTGGTSDSPMAVLSSTTCGASIELLICSANGSTNGPQYLGLERCNNFFGPLSTNPIPLNTWTHVAATVGSDKTVSYYVNGVPSGSWAGSPLDFSIGTSVNLGDNSNRRFDGILDEVEIWNRALSPFEIMFYRSLSLNGNVNGLYAYYHFNEGAGTTTANSGSGAGATGTLVGSPVWTNRPVTLYQFLPLTNSLATSNMFEGPSAGMDSIVMAVSPLAPSWSNTANAPWLHLSAANQAGSGSTNIVFTFDQNTGATRTGTLTIAGQTLTVTQGGSTYVQLTLMDARENTGPSIPALVTSGVYTPESIAVDAAGNIYVSETFHNYVSKWTASSNLLTTNAPSFASPTALAVDGAGNLYIAGGQSSAVFQRLDALTQTLTTVPLSGFTAVTSLALDLSGNLYITDNGAVYKYSLMSNTLTTVVSGLMNPVAVNVDVAGNIYYAGNYFIGEKLAANGATITLATTNGPDRFSAMAVDPSGNVYFSAYTGYYFYRRNVLDGTTSDISSLYGPLLHPHSMAIDASGNIYVADYGNSDVEGPSIEVAVRAFIDSAPPVLPGNGGTATWGLVPSSFVAADLFAPSIDDTWLTIVPTNGTIGMSVPPNPSQNSRSTTVIPRGNFEQSYLQQFTVTQASSLINLYLTPSGTTQGTLSWSPTWSGLILQETTNLNASNWTNSPSGSTNPVSIPLAGPKKFYRVKSQ